MFMICESMKWSHLPVGGGIYDQDPDLLDGFTVIFQERNAFEVEEQKKRDREMGPSSRHKGRGPVAGRRR